MRYIVALLFTVGCSSLAESEKIGEVEQPVAECDGLPVNSHCSNGFCAWDGECRPMATCRWAQSRIASGHCEDSTTRRITINHDNVQYNGCYKAPDGSVVGPLTCPPGHPCVARIGYPIFSQTTEVNGVCE